MSMLSELHTTTSVSPLAVTPLLDPRETSIGYVLRLCDANGYDSPSMFLGGIGLKVTCQTLGGTASVLSALTLMDETLAGRAVVRKAEEAHSYFLFGRCIPGRQVSLHFHKICPLCIHKNGIHDASWHLSLITHCPEHRVPLVRECHRCGCGFRINRPGTNRCKCGALVSGNPDGPLCSAEVANLFSAVRAKLFDDVHIAKFPREFDFLEHTELNELLKLLSAMHSFVTTRYRDIGAAGKDRRDHAAMHAVAVALLHSKRGIDLMQEALTGQPIGQREYVPSAAFHWFKEGRARLTRSAGLVFLSDKIDAFLAGRRKYRPRSSVQPRL